MMRLKQREDGRAAGVIVGGMGLIIAVRRLAGLGCQLCAVLAAAPVSASWKRKRGSE